MLILIVWFLSCEIRVKMAKEFVVISAVIPSLRSGQRLSNSEESNIIEILRSGVYPEPQILRRFAPQNDMSEGLLRMTLCGLFANASNL